ncbi:hypothetical protein [Shimia sp. SK013]|uniref:hypothetical protein n=1 Tax=Shimia sp. SK013 TaxID=1389006 RepID=UPI00128FA1BB|nr:hypothetical protein [Shimia sp. SK013]
MDDLKSFLPTQTKAQAIFEDLGVDVDPLFNAGKDTTKQADKLGNDLEEIDALWTALTNDKTDDKAVLKDIDVLINDAEKIESDIGLFRKSTVKLDNEANTLMRKIGTAQQALKKRVLDDKADILDAENSMTRLENKQSEVDDGNWLEKWNNRVSIPLPDSGGSGSGFLDDVGSGISGFGDSIYSALGGDTAAEKRAKKRDIQVAINNLEIEQRKLEKKRDDVVQEQVTVQSELTMVGHVDKDAATLQNLAKTIKEKLIEAKNALEAEKAKGVKYTSIAQIRKFYEDRIGEDMKELHQWLKVFHS